MPLLQRAVSGESAWRPGPFEALQAVVALLAVGARKIAKCLKSPESSALPLLSWTPPQRLRNGRDQLVDLDPVVEVRVCRETRTHSGLLICQGDTG